MNSPIIYINSFIADYKLANPTINIEHFQEALFKKYILTKYDEENNLMLLYHKFDQPTNSKLERECRSLVIDMNTLSVVAYTCENPICNNEAQQLLINNPNETTSINVFRCYEGSLLSLFNVNNKWFLSTRRCLDSKTSIWNERSHYDMFMDVLNKEGLSFDEFTSKLNPERGYYFVLIHHENKSVINYTSLFGDNYTKLCIAFIRDKNTQEEVDDQVTGYQHIFMADVVDIKTFDEDNKFLNINLSHEGIIMKLRYNNVKDQLLKLQTVSYQFCRALGNDSNIFKGYIYLYQVNVLEDYINNSQTHKSYSKIINPKNTDESYDTVGVIHSTFKVLTSELFELFKILWNIKTGKNNNNTLYSFLPKEYKDILFIIRGIYYKLKAEFITSQSGDKQLIGIKDIYQQLKKLDIDIVYSLIKQRKLMFNWVNNNNDPNLQLFKNISTRCDKVDSKLIAIFTSKLFPNISPTEIPQ